MKVKKVLIIAVIIMSLAALLAGCSSQSNYAKITFYVDGEAVQSYWVTKGGSLDADLSVPDKEGMIGVWSVTNFDEVENDLRVDAIYSSANCTLTFKADGKVISTMTVKKNSSPLSVPSVPEKAGFDGVWNYTDFKNVTQDLTISAIYTPSVFTVSFYNGSDPYATRLVEYGKTLTNIPSLPTPPKDYSAKWVNETGAAPVFTDIKSDMKVDVYYYLTISLVGSYTTSTSLNFELEEEVASIASGNRAGYDFYGWYYDAEFGAEVVFPLVFDSNTTLYARWLKVSNAADFTFTDGTVTAYTGSEDNVVIPYKYSVGGSEIFVTKIGSNAFSGTSAVTISVPGTVTEFASYAFSNAFALEHILFPDKNNVSAMGEYVFDGCASLVSFAASDSLEILPAYAFNDCMSLAEVSLASITEIGAYAFNNIGVIPYLTVPATLAVVGEGAFAGMTDTDFIFTANNITALGSLAFADCRLLKVFTAPKLQTAGAGAFSGCGQLTAVTAVSNVKLYTLFGNVPFDDSYIVSVGETEYYLPLSAVSLTVVASPGSSGQAGGVMVTDAILDAYYVKNINFAGIFTNIDSYAFRLTDQNKVSSSIPLTVTLPSMLSKISAYAFATRTDLTAIRFPSTLYEIADGAFANLDKLSNVTIEESNGLTKMGANVFIGTKWLTEYTGVAKLGRIAVGFGTQYIAAGGRTTLVPDDLTGVTTIAPWAFANLLGLQEVEIAATVADIGENAFAGCTGLKKIVFPANAAVGEGALGGCSALEEITIGLSIALHTLFAKATFAGSYALEKGEDTYYIPASFSRLTVLSGGANEVISDSYARFTSLKALDLGEGITVIYDNAFAGNSSLASVSFPVSLTEIGKKDGDESITGAFAGCIMLSYIAIPTGSALKIVGEWAFYGTALTTLQLPQTTETVGAYAFGATKLYNLTFIAGSRPLTIGEYAFSGITTFSAGSSIIFPSNLTEIGAYAFYGSNIRNVTLNEGLTTLGEYAFANCDLRSFTIPSAVRLYEDEECLVTGLISGNPLLITLTLNAGVRISDLFDGISPAALATVNVNGGTILDRQFKDLTSLQMISMSGVTAIGANSFEGCTNENFKTVIIPASVLSIGDYAFKDCLNLANLLIFSGSVLENVEEGVFHNCAKLSRVIFPDTVINTEWNGIFNGCESLVETNIPLSVEYIDDYTFANCNSLAELYIPAGVVGIGNSAFYNCISTNFTNAHFPRLTALGENAFYNCVKLQSFKAEIIATIGENAFYGCTAMTEITVVDSSAAELLGDVSLLVTVNVSAAANTMDESAFEACVKLNMIFFAGGDTAVLQDMLSVLASAVSNGKLNANVGIFVQNSVYKSEDITIPSVLNVYPYPTVFRESDFTVDEETKTAVINSVSGVTGVLYIPGTVIKGGEEYTVSAIGREAFKGNAGITSVIIPSSVAVIEAEAFSGCGNLAVITFEAGSVLTQIGDFAFDNCAFTVLKLPDSLISIGLGAFYGCENLTSVATTANGSLAYIGEYAFGKCEKLTSFYVKALPEYHENSFWSWDSGDFTILGE